MPTTPKSHARAFAPPELRALILLLGASATACSILVNNALSEKSRLDAGTAVGGAGGATRVSVGGSGGAGGTTRVSGGGSGGVGGLGPSDAAGNDGSQGGGGQSASSGSSARDAGCDAAVAADCTCPTGCTLPNATAACAAGLCEIVLCATNHDDCNGQRGDGCEADLMNDVLHCGDCTTACNGNRVCDAGACTK